MNKLSVCGIVFVSCCSEFVLDKLNSPSLYTIVDHLDDDSVANFRLVSRKCYSFVEERHGVWFELARLLRDKYDIFYTNLNCEIPAWRALKQCQIFLLGESHISPDDRLLNAQMVNHIRPDKLVVEGRVKIIRKGRGQLAHIDESIAERAESWDVQDNELHEAIRRLDRVRILATKSYLKDFSISEDSLESPLFAEQFMSLCEVISLELSVEEIYRIDRLDALSRKVLYSGTLPQKSPHIVRCRHVNFHPLFYKKSAARMAGRLRGLSRWEYDTLYSLERRVRLSALIFEIGLRLWDHWQSVEDKKETVLDRFRDERNNRLCQRLDESSNDGQRVVGIAGAAHVSNSHLKERLAGLNKGTLSLVPKESNDECERHPEALVGDLSAKERVLRNELPNNYYIDLWVHGKALFEEVEYWADTFDENVKARDAFWDARTCKDCCIS